MILCMSDSPTPRPVVDRKAMMLENVRTNAYAQATTECMENYLKSCEAHGGDMAEVVKMFREERLTIIKELVN